MKKMKLPYLPNNLNKQTDKLRMLLHNISLRADRQKSQKFRNKGKL